METTTTAASHLKTRSFYRLAHKYTLTPAVLLRLVPNHLNLHYLHRWLSGLFLPSFFINFQLVARDVPLPSSLPFCSSLLLPLSIFLHFFHVAVTVSHGRSAVGLWLAAFLWWFASVRVVVEVGKEDDEGDSIADQSPLHPAGEGAASVEGITSVADGYMELDLFNIKKRANLGKGLRFIIDCQKRKKETIQSKHDRDQLHITL